MIGSSPRVWGTRLPSAVLSFNDRFIPTRVGNTPWHGWRRRRPSVHPHACGEHKLRIGKACTSSGSSPRVWGTQNRAVAVKCKLRFIPTRVGNTSRSRLLLFVSAVHPHACGEHAHDASKMQDGFGSSPRVWGTRGGEWRERDSGRFIPTRVGNTYHTFSPKSETPVHPHACGEHFVVLVVLCVYGGSSPRVWGTLGTGCKCHNKLRFIPTRVGNTLR